LQTWNDAFAFGSVGIQPIYTPKPPFQTRLGPATGLDHSDDLLIAQKLCNAIHPGLSIRKLAIPGNWRLSLASSVPVSDGARIKMVQRDSEFSHPSQPCSPSPSQIWRCFQRSKRAVFASLGQRPNIRERNAFQFVSR